eukprot:CAMPEP_0119106200 /NCGR_PEP_ID=MMETSP1180-20130426/3960_1 /TAXON_ID=3052 ORGANISM="Chlamydomonas cf sp, Strain CCMP681" /NCGR_SAMPLE_ID=MMETSP1180 /ASSEMBLY_ACC=CAM_ASM_000741 /LENGTH=295 /DNA_ID=CAMNT_0007091471 /DNA_START=131 /DNA_END=1018 /DNA_ORIENTATION=-
MTSPVRPTVVAYAKKVSEPSQDRSLGDLVGLGDGLGPIGMTIGGDPQPKASRSKTSSNQGNGSSLPPLSNGGIELGPIGLTLGGVATPSDLTSQDMESSRPPSIHSMTTEQWRAQYQQADGTVDLWVEEEFNAGSRLMGGRAVHNGGVYGFRTGEGVSAGDVTSHKVKIYDHYSNQVLDVEVPEDRYILWEAEDKGLELPYACRMGCCTACAVRVKEGTLIQPEALGISEELKEKGYALMCVCFPTSDLVLETVSEDEVYELQFGESFAQQALDPSNPGSVKRDDWALEIANMDE